MKDYIFTFCIKRMNEGYSNIKIIASALTAEEAYDKAVNKARKAQGADVENEPAFIEVEILGKVKYETAIQS